MVFFDFLGQEQADIAAAQDQQAAGFRFLVAEGGHGARQLFAVDHEIDLVSRQHLVLAGWNDRLAVAHDADDDDIEVGE